MAGEAGEHPDRNDATKESDRARLRAVFNFGCQKRLCGLGAFIWIAQLHALMKQGTLAIRL